MTSRHLSIEIIEYLKGGVMVRKDERKRCHCCGKIMSRVDKKENDERIRKYWEELAKRITDAYSMRLDGKKYREIGEALGITSVAARVRCIKAERMIEARKRFLQRIKETP
jgi:hypothetical protein